MTRKRTFPSEIILHFLPVTAQIHEIKADKACGPDGTSPCVFNLLSANWSFSVTTFL